MGGPELAALLKWPALVGGFLLLIYGAVKLIQRGAAKRATASDDLAESAVVVAEQQRQAEAMARPSPTTKDDILAARKARRDRALRGGP